MKEIVKTLGMLFFGAGIGFMGSQLVSDAVNKDASASEYAYDMLIFSSCLTNFVKIAK